MNTLTEVMKKLKDYNLDSTTICVDNDIVFADNMDFAAHPNDILVEALELLGFKVEFV